MNLAGATAQALTSQPCGMQGEPAVLMSSRPAGDPMKALRVRNMSNGQEERGAWSHYVQSRPQATPYHGMAWRRIFGQCFGYPSWYLLAEHEQTGKVVGCLPLFSVKSPSAHRIVAVPFRDRGGPLWDEPAAFHLLVAEAKRIVQDEGADFLELKSIHSYPGELVREAGLAERRYWVRSAIDLGRFESGTLLESLGPKIRNKIRQAQRHDLVYEDITTRGDCLGIWYALYIRSQTALGLPPFPRRFFGYILEELVACGAVRVFATRGQGGYLAAAVVLLQGRHAIFAYSGSDPSVRSQRPNDFLIYGILKWLCDRGFEELDLGSDSPKQESLLAFKKKWLAEQSVIPSYAWGSVNYHVSDSSDVRYGFARRMYKRIPPRVSALIGSRFTKYCG